MKSPSPTTGVLAALGWAAGAAVALPILVPPLPGYRTLVVAVAVTLFVLALRARRLAFVLAVLCAGLGGISALVFDLPEPAAAGPVVLAGYFAGSALRQIYDIDEPTPRGPLLSLWRAFAVASGVSAVAAWVSLRTSYLLLHEVPPPRTVNVLGEDVVQSISGIVATLAALAVAAGAHRAASRLLRDAKGRRAVDVALVSISLLAGSVALLQRLHLLPIWRAARWQEWGRAQATFTDPSAAGVAVALLAAPLLAVAASGPASLRVLAGAAAALQLLVLADAGSRAGFVGTVTASVVFVLWALTRMAVGARPGVRRRVAASVASLAMLSSLVFFAALFWSSGGQRAVLVRRLESTFQKEPTPYEKAGNRLVLYEASFALFREHPVVGIGLGAFRAELPNAAREILNRRVEATDHPPSLYLGTLVESGLAGAALLLLLLLGLVRGLVRSLTPGPIEHDEALRTAGAGAAIAGLLLVLLFGSHLVYPEIALLAGILTARLPLPEDGRTGRLLSALLPVVLAGALVLLLGGILARAYESATPRSAFRRGSTAGVFVEEREPDGRPFRWTGSAAAWWVSETDGGPPCLVLPVKNARPDGRAVTVDVFFDDRLRGRVTLARGIWERLELAIDGPGVLRLVPSATFRPSRRFDSRRLGIEVGEVRVGKLP